MKQCIIITEVKITRAGEIKLFQIPLPKNTYKVVGVATDVRLETDFDLIGVHDVGVGVGDDGGGGEVIGGGHDNDLQWQLVDNKLAGRLVIQSMEKANIFFYEQVWTIGFNDGISNLESVESFDAFALLKKPEPKVVSVPFNTTTLNCLYRDAIGSDNENDVIYYVKVLLWVEFNNE